MAATREAGDVSTMRLVGGRKRRRMESQRTREGCQQLEPFYLQPTGVQVDSSELFLEFFLINLLIKK